MWVMVAGEEDADVEAGAPSWWRLRVEEAHFRPAREVGARRSRCQGAAGGRTIGSVFDVGRGMC